MNIGIVSLFPQLFEALNYGIVGRAIEQQLVNLVFSNPRDFGLGKHQAVDDKPYGGGAGMVMRVEPLLQAIATCQASLPSPTKRIYLSPQGQPLTQTIVAELANLPSILLVCGRYEGIDERVLELAIDVEYSLGDFVLSGGEFAACALIDAVTRLQPGAVGGAESTACDSFSAGLLEYPQYTRPETFQDKHVPDVLLSGDHALIAKWRKQQALIRTKIKRPDLLAQLTLTTEEQALLDELTDHST